MEAYYVETLNANMKADGMECFQQNVQPETLGARGHIHDAIELIYMKEGDFQVMVNEAQFVAERGDVFLFRSNAMHRIYAQSQPVNQYYVLKVQPSFLLELGSEKNAIGYVLRFALAGSGAQVYWSARDPAGEKIRQAFDVLVSELNTEESCRDLSMKLAAGQVLLAILRELLKTEQQKGESTIAADSAAAQIYRMIRYINLHYGEELDARSCSELVNMSYSYFSRSFKRVTGRSFKEYLNEVRINHAQQLLMTTDMSVMQIALECGYNNVSYFIMLYKTIKGVTPLNSRKAEMGGERKDIE